MEDMNLLSQRIEKLKHEHKTYVKFGAMCFIGIIASGMIIDHTHTYSLWLLVLFLTVALISTIVITVKKDLQKEQYLSELQSLNSNRDIS